MRLDHLVVTAPTLEEGTAWAEARLGLPLDPGGRHDAFATHNRLLSLGPGLYLEVIAPEPGPAPRPRWFGLEAPGPPRLAHWVVRVDDLDAALAARPEAGEALSLARGPFSWRVAVPPSGALPPHGLPTLIQWTGPHPADRLPDRGVRLLSLSLRTPRPELLPLRDPRVAVTPGPAGLSARLRTPQGEAAL